MLKLRWCQGGRQAPHSYLDAAQAQGAGSLAAVLDFFPSNPYFFSF